MDDSTATEHALARAFSALVREHEVQDVLTTLVADARGELGADSIGILMSSAMGELELLVATSHAVAELELFQAQQEAGPCPDCIRSGEWVSESGDERLVARWGQVGTRIVDSGFEAVRAYPLRWYGETLGALNLFYSTPPTASDLDQLGQAFADVATVVILHPEELSRSEITSRTERALEARKVVEQAKGVIAYQDRITIAEAYERLRAKADELNTSLTRMASAVIRGAQRLPRS